MKNRIVYITYMLAMTSNSFAAAEAKKKASSSAQQYLKALITSPFFQGAVDCGLIIFAILKWYDYINNFTPETAFKNILVPAFITAFAFNWLSFLSWVNII